MPGLLALSDASGTIYYITYIHLYVRVQFVKKKKKRSVSIIISHVCVVIRRVRVTCHFLLAADYIVIGNKQVDAESASNTVKLQRATIHIYI